MLGLSVEGQADFKSIVMNLQTPKTMLQNNCDFIRIAINEVFRNLDAICLSAKGNIKVMFILQAVLFDLL